MKRLLLALAVGGARALAGCGGHGPTAGGVVTAKVHVPEVTSLIPIVNCMPSGQSTICTTTYIPVIAPECWRVMFDDHGQRGDKCIPRARWDAVKVGDYFDTEGETP